MVAALMAGCVESPTPTCQQAVAHYYTAGCAYTDTAGMPIAQPEAVAECLTNVRESSGNCGGELDTWLRCNNQVLSPAKNPAQCDCSRELMGLLACN